MTDRSKPDLIDKTNMRRMLLGVDVISSHSVVDRPQEIASASFFFTSLGEFRLLQVVYIDILSFLWSATGRLPAVLSNSEKRSNTYLPMGQSVERKLSKEWNRSDFQCLIRARK
jgi:hypothetical protein